MTKRLLNIILKKRILRKPRIFLHISLEHLVICLFGKGRLNMNRRLSFKKKHLFWQIPLFVLLVITLGGIIVLALLYIGFSWENKKNENYCKGANWNISIQDFETNYFPIFSNYFQEEFEKNGLIKSPFDVKKKDHFYSLSYIDDDKSIYLSYTVYESFCLFSSQMQINYDKLEIKYDYLEKYDIILTEFGEEHFYDFSIVEGVLKDLYKDDETYGDNHLYFDNIIGNIGSYYEFNIDKNYVTIEVNSLLRGMEL